MKKYIELFLTFFKLGATTFGGGYAMMSLLKETIVDKHHWLTNDEILQICAIAESTPGPIAINLSTYVGYKKGKFLGSLLATIGVVLPSFITIYIISLFFNQFIENKYVAYAFVGIKCAVLFLIIKSAYKMIKEMDKKPWQILLIILVSLLMIILDLLSVNFSSIFLIIIGAFIGVIADFSSKKVRLK